jgi:hypothetical protein
MDNSAKPQIFPPDQFWAIGGFIAGVFLTLVWGKDDVWAFLTDFGALLGGLATAAGIIVALRVAREQIEAMHKIRKDQEAARLKAIAIKTHATLNVTATKAATLHRQILNILQDRSVEWTVERGLPNILASPNPKSLLRTYHTFAGGLVGLRVPDDAFEIGAEQPQLAEHLSYLMSNMELFNIIREGIKEILENPTDPTNTEERVTAYLNSAVENGACCIEALAFALHALDKTFDLRQIAHGAYQAVNLPPKNWPGDNGQILQLAETNPPVDWDDLGASATVVWRDAGKEGDVPTRNPN